MLRVELRQTHPVSLEATLACAPGELLAVVGPSGTGKSTLLKSIAGLLHGATGLVRVGETTWLDTAAGVDVPVHRRPVGFVFQSYGLFPHMTVLENVMAGASGSGAQRRAQAVSALEAVHMVGLEGRMPFQLSGGQQQRVGVARALARQPQLLLLDEPFSAVDQMTKERLYEELAELRSTLAIPTVLVTHSIPEAQVLADRMVVLHRGRTLQEGAPQDVYRHPADADVARLMGHKNVFAAQLRREQGATVLTWEEADLQVRSDLPAGPVRFCVATDDVRLIEPGAAMENTLDAAVVRMVSVGANTRVYARLATGTVLALTAPKHVLRRRGIEVGRPVRLSLPVDAVHVMPG
ncbi:ABC transporter ATP-binding protein [Ramlibacter sp. AN1015]|uniref:ABC transporter ATP-binding protein n=1 Tax=Ramlibacter sp. AN1015 TaxID=3133428 RepID=UPI0030BB6CE7